MERNGGCLERVIAVKRQRIGGLGLCLEIDLSSLDNGLRCGERRCCCCFGLCEYIHYY